MSEIIVNQTEVNLTKICDDFIIHMLTENDPEQLLYEKMREMVIDQEEEDIFIVHQFRNWTYDILKRYLANGHAYQHNTDKVIAGKYIRDWCTVPYEEIFVNGIELMELQNQLLCEQWDIDDEIDTYKLLTPKGILNYFMEIYINKIFYELHDHIIKLIENRVIPK